MRNFKITFFILHSHVQLCLGTEFKGQLSRKIECRDVMSMNGCKRCRKMQSFHEMGSRSFGNWKSLGTSPEMFETRVVPTFYSHDSRVHGSFVIFFKNNTKSQSIHTPHPPTQLKSIYGNFWMSNFSSLIMVSFLRRTRSFNENLYSTNSLLKYTGIKFLPRSMRKFCIDIVKATVDSRERHGTVKKDLMQSMIQLRNNNAVEHSDEFKLDANGMISSTSVSKI